MTSLIVPQRPEYIHQANLFLDNVTKEYKSYLKYARNLCRNGDDASDLVQESILRCHARIERLGFKGRNYRFYLFTSIKQNFYWGKRDDKKHYQYDEAFDQTLSGYLNTGSSELCNAKVDALARQIDVFITSHYEPRYVGWWQMHLHGLTYEEISFGENVQAPRICKVIKKIKTEVREEFKYRAMDLVSD